MNAKQIARVLIVVLAALALTALVAAAQDAPGAPQKAGPAYTERGETASPAANLNESEPNNSFGTADVVGLFDVVAGKIGVAGDSDYYHIYDDYMPGYTTLIDIDAQINGSLLDAKICVYDENFVELACNDDSDGLDSMIYIAFPDPEDTWVIDFYVRVQELNHGNEGGNDYTYTLSNSHPYFVSPVANGTVSGLAFQKGDILARNTYKDGSTKWILFFDASDVGITQNTNSIDVSPAGAALAFQRNQAIAGLGTATPYDVVWFNANRWGAMTDGWFSNTFLLDGSTLGLTTSGEKIDALTDVTPGAWATISTTGPVTVPMSGGGNLKARHEDVIRVNLATGKWDMVFDGSTVPGLGTEDVIAIDHSGDSVDDWLDIVVEGSGVVNGNSVNQKKVIQCYDLWPDWCDPYLEFPFTVDAVSFKW